MLITWLGLDEPGTERLTLAAGESGVSAASEVRTADRVLSYSAALTPGWVFRTLDVRTDDGVRVQVTHEPDGPWRVDGVARADLAPAIDIDLAFSPFTNTLPIRRLALEVGASADIVVAYIARDLTVTPAPQRYTRVGDARYLYESLDIDFREVITVDADGLVVDYPELFRRVP